MEEMHCPEGHRPMVRNGIMVNPAILQKWVPYSQRYLVLRLVGLVGLALWLVSWIALNKYRCE